MLVKYNGAKQNEYFDYDTKTKELHPIIGQNEQEEYDVSYAPKDNQYLVLSNKTTDFKRLYLLADGKLKQLTEDLNYEIAGFSLDHEKTRIIYSINREGFSDIKGLDAKTFKPISIPKLPIKNAKINHIFAASTTRDGKVTMLGIITSKAPRLAYSYDWSAKKLTQWVLPSAPEVDLSTFVDSELMHYETRDKVKYLCSLGSPKNVN